jgi:hypothetical protein
MVMHARDPARGLLTPRGMLTLCVFARRVVRNMPTADADVATRHRDGVRSAMAAERTTAAMTTSTSTSTTSAVSTAASTVAAAATAATASTVAAAATAATTTAATTTAAGS